MVYIGNKIWLWRAINGLTHLNGLDCGVRVAFQQLVLNSTCAALDEVEQHLLIRHSRQQFLARTKGGEKAVVVISFHVEELEVVEQLLVN